MTPGMIVKFDYNGKSYSGKVEAIKDMVSKGILVTVKLTDHTDSRGYRSVYMGGVSNLQTLSS